MAKKKNKKTQKKSELTSPPPSPKPATEEAVPAEPAPAPLSLSEPALTESLEKDPASSLDASDAVKLDPEPVEEPKLEVPTSPHVGTGQDLIQDPPTQEPLSLSSPSPKSEGPKEEDTTEAAPEAPAPPPENISHDWETIEAPPPVPEAPEAPPPVPEPPSTQAPEAPVPPEAPEPPPSSDIPADDDWGSFLPKTSKKKKKGKKRAESPAPTPVEAEPPAPIEVPVEEPSPPKPEEKEIQPPPAEEKLAESVEKSADPEPVSVADTPAQEVASEEPAAPESETAPVVESIPPPAPEPEAVEQPEEVPEEKPSEDVKEPEPETVQETTIAKEEVTGPPPTQEESQPPVETKEEVKSPPPSVRSPPPAAKSPPPTVKSPPTVAKSPTPTVKSPPIKTKSPAPAVSSPASSVRSAKIPKTASPLSAPVAPEPIPNSPRSIATERPPLPKPAAVNQVIEESRPPAAPSPPTSKVRPRHTSAFETDDEDDSALIQPRLRGENSSRDSSRGSTYPPAGPPHSRSLFASRVPVDPYANQPPPPPPPPQQAPPGYHHPRYYPPTAPPYYHGPSHMSQSGYSNHPSYGHSSHTSHSSSPYQESWSHIPPNYGPYNNRNPHDRHDSLASREYMGLPAIENGSAIDEDGDVFSRIAQAIPDLHVLLAKYKETHGQLGVREELLRRADLEQQERLHLKEQEIHTLRERLTHLEAKHSAEASRLRLEIGNMEEQVRELKEQLAETGKYKQDAEQLKVALDTSTRYWESKYKELEEAHTTLQRTSAEEAAKSRKEFDEWKSTATTKHDAEKIALAIQFDKKLKEADVMAENLRQEAATAFLKEKDELRSEHQRQQREREANFDNLRHELETKLGAAQLDCEQALKREREGMEVWAKERGTLVQAHREDIESLRKSWDEQRSLLEGQHRKIKDESDKAWIELHAEANRKAEERQTLVDQLMKEKDELQRQYNELKSESGKERDIIKSVANNLESEKARLERLMECYGDIAEIKSKGDTYYLVSFTQLQKQIMDLAATHFVHLPVAPPPEDLALVPSTLPSFLGETPASRQVRAAYVAHTISKLVTYRVFGPFLFSLGRRYDKADSLFSSMSSHIREKSTRKEAIWRQQTLLAAFTSSGAKQRINTAAGTVVEEIVNAIKNFAAPKEEEAIKIAVKRIVKLAAETWRFARLERELIIATMPAIEDEEHQFTGPEFWPPDKSDSTPIASLAGTSPPSDERPKLLLRLFPVIYREPQHENFREPGDDYIDEGCVYHHGLALYDDSDPVVQRAEELRAAGLPPTTNASPTAADFPPPLVPAPREPLPSPPAADKNSERAKSPALEVPKKASSSRSKSPSTKSTKSTKTTDRASTAASTPKSEAIDKRSQRSSIPPLPAPTELSEAVTAPKASVRSKSPPAEVSDKVSDKISAISSIPPPLPTPTEISAAQSAPKSSRSKRSSANYTRPPPGPVDFNTPRDAPLPAPTESIVTSNNNAPASSHKDEPPLPAPTASIAPSTHGLLAHELLNDKKPPPPSLTQKESSILPKEDPPTPPEPTRAPPSPPTPQETPNPNDRPISPLFAAIDEIEALESHHRSRTPSTSTRSHRSRRRSRPSATATEAVIDDDIDDVAPPAAATTSKAPEPLLRRTSASHAHTHGLTHRTSSDQASLRSDKTDRTERSSGSKYICESRSAAVKGLYPNSPLAGASPNLSRTNSIRGSVGEKKRKGGASGAAEPSEVPGTWDTDSESLRSVEVGEAAVKGT